MKKKLFVSLFSGAGGLDQGFISAGWSPVLMMDCWKPAVETLKKNHPSLSDHIYNWDIAALDYARFDRAMKKAGGGDIKCIIGGPPCLPGDQRIITISGPKPICEIKRGDLVLTTKGRYRQVLSTGSQTVRNAALYGLRPQGYPFFTWFTGNHPILMKRKERQGFVPASMVVERDKIGFPVVQAQTETAERFAGKLGRSESFWFLVGAYLRDGFMRGGPSKSGKKRYEIMFAPGNKEGLAARRILECLSDLGLHSSIDGSNGNCKIHVNNKQLWLLLECFGRGALNKCPPEEFLSLPDFFLISLLEGLSETDGCEFPDKCCDWKGNTVRVSAIRQITSISLPMLEWVQRALLRFGHLGNIRKICEAGPGEIQGRQVNCHTCYELCWIPHPTKRSYEISDGILWIPMEETKVRHETTKVYNLEVENDHTFCAHLIGTHNCQPFSRLNQNQLFDAKPGSRGEEKEGNMNDPRRSLFMDFLRLVAHAMPPFMVMENVFDLKNRKLGGDGPEKDKLIVDIIQQEFDKAGYDVAKGVLDARNYDVPQMRRRMIFIGVRKDLGIVPELPAPMPLATSVRAEFAKIRPDHPNQARKKPSEGWLRRARHIPPGGYYNDLPLEHKVLKPVDIDYVSEYDGQVRHYCFKRADGSWDEFRTSKDADKIARFMGCHEGWELSMPQLESDAEGCQIFRVMPRMGTYLRRIRWDVSHTVTRNPLIHPQEHRELTVREKAAIQTFPPDYEFCGKLQDQHVLVGNAVPCNLGRAISRHIEAL